MTAFAAGPGGWVSGNPASLAASATVVSLFDLGQDWSQYTRVQISISPASPSTGFSGVKINSSDNVTLDVTRALNEVDGTAFGSLNASITTASGAQVATVRPLGRFLHVSMTNADATNAMGAGAICIIGVYPV